MKPQNAPPIPARHIIGFYSRSGYWIMLQTPTRQYDLYAAGNSPLESQTWLAPDDPAALPLRRIRAACIATAREIAQEEHAAYLGVEREEEPEL